MNLPEYSKHKDHDEIIASAYLAVKTILHTPLYPRHKRDLIDICIWKISEVDGKYRTRFMSLGAVQDYMRGDLRHEHVVERKKLVDELIDNPDDYEKILDNIVIHAMKVN